LSSTQSTKAPRPASAQHLPDTEEDEALARAVSSYREQAGANFSALEAFVAEHPQSGWRVALLTDLGFAYLHDGYFSRTIEAWETAWREGKELTEPRARTLVDRTVGELARLGSCRRRDQWLCEAGREVHSSLGRGALCWRCRPLSCTRKRNKHQQEAGSPNEA
jgi:hypothetical protein